MEGTVDTSRKLLGRKFLRRKFLRRKFLATLWDQERGPAR
jgi:hypothetical protein